MERYLDSQRHNTKAVLHKKKLANLKKDVDTQLLLKMGERNAELALIR